MELPRLASQKGCFAAYYARSIDELSGRTTGLLGYNRQHSAYAIGGTVSNDRTSDYGPAGAAGAKATPQHQPEQQDRSTELLAGGSSE